MPAAIHAQVSYPLWSDDAKLITAEDLFQQKLYGLTIEQALTDYSKANINKKNFLLQSSSVLESRPLKSNTAFKEYPISPIYKAYNDRISFWRAEKYFANNEAEDAIPFYLAAGIENLSNKEVTDAKFELAYCYLVTGQLDKAENYFLAIKDVPNSKYYKAGNYYYGLIAYNNHNYAAALASFEKVKDEKNYKSVVPYYIAEIHYFTNNKDTALAVCKGILAKKEKCYYENEVYLLAGQCYFDAQKYEEAKPYFEYYLQHTEKIRKEDQYKVAYTYYKTGDCHNATNLLKQLSELKDSLGQSSMYVLGDCYLKLNDKVSSRNAFAICAEMNFNSGMQEGAMMLYAKLSYELGYMTDALNGYKNLLKYYPNTTYKDEANLYITDLMLRTNSFEDAIQNLQKVTVKNAGYWKLMQRAYYGRGVMLYKAANWDDALQAFQNVTVSKVDTAYFLAAQFWIGEIAYKQRNWQQAISAYNDFIAQNKVRPATLNALCPQATVAHAYLAAGFAAVNAQKFGEAQQFFNKAQHDTSNLSNRNIARLQEAEALFMQQKYKEAIYLYDRIAMEDSANAHYAIFQKSILLGLLGKNNEKISTLSQLINLRPPSSFDLQARYETAVTLIELEKYAQAKQPLQYITDSSSNAGETLKPQAWLKLGYCNEELKDNANAMKAYKTVVLQYWNTEERISAMDAIRNLYIESNDPGGFGDFIAQNKLPDTGKTALETAFYFAGENLYSAGKWQEANAAFNKYIATFPNGLFALKAHYYRGETYSLLGKANEALIDYDSVLSHSWSDFSENSCIKAAEIAYTGKAYQKAFQYYQTVLQHTQDNPTIRQKSHIGLMKTAYFLNKYDTAIHEADSTIALPGIQPNVAVEAQYYKAKSLQASSQPDSALQLYLTISHTNSGEWTAESKYRIAEIMFQKDSLTAAETAANETIQWSGGYEYWLVKSYLLLADIFMVQKDYFNAKATLSSIVKNTKICTINYSN
ncbi:MAG: hypothetical protein EBX41_07045, partial [Chitinophagia bacterium]|nr:hypothetical protein [Chitinophagia bacterium]